jgi:ABC-2 type transport system permease protein
LYMMYLFGPIIGLALSFDAINRERTEGSLSVLLSQPIFRDSIINGKFLAGIGALSLVAISTVGIMSGVAIPLLGFGPGPDEIVRILLFTLITILYLAVWYAIGLFFSTVTRKTTTSMLMSISVWIMSILVISIIASLVANAVYSTQFPEGLLSYSYSSEDGGTYNPNQGLMDEWQERMQANSELRQMIQRISPSVLYQEAASSITSVRGIVISGPTTVVNYGSSSSIYYAGAEEDMLSSWPQITVLAVILIVCFAASYMLFLRQEIRAGA